MTADVILRDELQQRREQVDSLQQLLDECCVEAENHCNWKDLPERIKKMKEGLDEVEKICLSVIGENNAE